MISSLTFCSGGFGTGGISMCGVGNGAFPPSLKAYRRLGPGLGSGVALARAGANRRDPEPPPPEEITYCSPIPVNLTGLESTADVVWMDQSFLPESAAQTHS